MPICELISTYDPECLLRFEYCYLGTQGEYLPEESLSYEGPAGGFAEEMAKRSPMVLHLYATCNESGDFEVVENSADRIRLRYVDFR